MYPCYGFSFLFSAQWYQNIANDMFTPKGNGRLSHPAPPAPEYVGHLLIAMRSPATCSPMCHPRACEHLARSLKLKVADNWYRIILVLVFLLEVLACSLVPIIGQPLSFVLLCWLYAYYSFEYAGPQGQACSGAHAAHCRCDCGRRWGGGAGTTGCT